MTTSTELTTSTPVAAESTGTYAVVEHVLKTVGLVRTRNTVMVGTDIRQEFSEEALSQFVKLLQEDETLSALIDVNEVRRQTAHNALKKFIDDHTR